MRRVAALLALAGTLAISFAAGAEETAAVPAGEPAAARVAGEGSTADHSKFKELQTDFKTGPEVTKACLHCHTEAAKQIHKTKHWRWEVVNPQTGQTLGKKHVVNNFCTATASNENFCSACHIGYGWKDDTFDFTAEENVDCVVCHDTTGTYQKPPGLAGHPNYERMESPPKSGRFREAVDLKKVAQNVGKTSRRTCGTCHFFGGGGNAVKHGDLDSSLTEPKRYLDVHMQADGLDFSCSTCHVSDAHEVAGSRYATTASDDKGAQVRGKQEGKHRATCQSCHSEAPHAQERLNVHARKLACQSCHVPEYARGPLPTKMSWDWSTAGRLDDNGNRLQVKNSGGQVAYDSFKGDFTYDRYVIPDYVWYNGTIRYTLFDDKVDPDKVVKINEFMGGPDDPDARIWPVKTFTGKQPIDAERGTLAVFHTAGKDKAAFWGNYNWDEALKVGMKARGVDYSGQLAFVATEMRWPITHMVAPKDDAVACDQCHRENGRLKEIGGVYLPSRDRNALVDRIGWGLALLTLIGVLLHGAIRIITSRARG